MIAACDTFRAGAVEQLKTHVHRINGVHADSVKLFEQGYGKDPATIAMHAISAARDQGYDVCLIDTAGRMQVFCARIYELPQERIQDNEPLMRALAKLIAINRPDAVLFVGEALVGNDAIDQLTKFNKSLANHRFASGRNLK
jgi:signal recognition particle receptor subunit alpha